MREEVKLGQGGATEEKRALEITSLSCVVAPLQQVDKGVVPLAGTNGETTTQGENRLAPSPTHQPTQLGTPLGAQGVGGPRAPSSAML